MPSLLDEQLVLGFPVDVDVLRVLQRRGGEGGVLHEVYESGASSEEAGNKTGTHVVVDDLLVEPVGTGCLGEQLDLAETVDCDNIVEF